MEMVRQVAPLDSPVILLGETGVGKEVITNAIHATSLRNDGPLVTVNCGAIPENLLDSFHPEIPDLLFASLPPGLFRWKSQPVWC
jgi:DNA-binding NtrC family response regulator